MRLGGLWGPAFTAVLRELFKEPVQRIPEGLFTPSPKYRSQRTPQPQARRAPIIIPRPIQTYQDLEVAAEIMACHRGGHFKMYMYQLAVGTMSNHQNTRWARAGYPGRKDGNWMKVALFARIRPT